jgi:hypothetical protein
MLIIFGQTKPKRSILVIPYDKLPKMATGDKFVDENRCGFRCLASAAERTFGGPYGDRDQDPVSFRGDRRRVR